MIYIRLFFEFCKVGLFAVGGGLAILPFLYKISDRTGWYTYQELMNILADFDSVD